MRPHFPALKGERPPGVAYFDSTEGGALQLAHEKDDYFVAQLKALVPAGFLTFSRRPYCWVIHEDYADDALALAYRYFEDVLPGIV